MELYKDKLKKVHGYEEGTAEAVDAQTSAKAIDYRKTVCKSYLSLNPEQIDFRLTGSKFFVTRKYDGEMSIIFFDNNETVIVNRSGRVRRGIPCVEEAGRLLAQAGIKQAVIPAELYVDESAGRCRIFDLLATLSDEKSISRLRLAAFDILEIDSAPFKAASYADTCNKLNAIFAKGETCKTVRTQQAASKSEVKDLYVKWVEGEDAEGLVVRCEMPFVFKIKPRYTVDVAVVGFSEGTGDQKGQIRTLLLAMMPKEGQYQIVGRTGSGFSIEQRIELLEKFTPKIIGSRYIETDSNHVAFHTVKPDTVIELNVNDVLFETPSGGILNPLLEIVDNAYTLRANVPGVSFVYPVFERFRDDKTGCFDDIRLSQVNRFSFVPSEVDTPPIAEQAKSQLLHRAVYIKESGAKIMVQKFMAWKTNKENLSEYPAYVFHYTNFSSDRKEPLQREVYISDDKEQIMQMMNDAKQENIKKGWVMVD